MAKKEKVVTTKIGDATLVYNTKQNRIEIILPSTISGDNILEFKAKHRKEIEKFKKAVIDKNISPKPKPKPNRRLVTKYNSKRK